MLRHKTVLGLLDLSLLRGIKSACAKFALKGVPKEKQSWAIIPGDGREPTAGLPMLAPRFYRERSHSPRKRFLSNRSLTTTQSSRVGHSPKGAGTSERSHRLFAGCDREARRRDNGKRRYAMGDKGKKDKDKARKQKIKKQEQTAKKNLEKLPTKTPA